MNKIDYENDPKYFDSEEGCVIVPPVKLADGKWGTYRGTFGWFESSEQDEVIKAHSDYMTWLIAMDAN